MNYTNHCLTLLSISFLLLISTFSLHAQVPTISPDTEDLEATVANNARDLKHFMALYSVITDEAETYPKTLTGLYPLVEDLQVLGQELGHPYDIYAITGKQLMYAVVCPRLSNEQRDSARVLYHQVLDLIGTPTTTAEAETLLKAHTNMFPFCVSEWSRDSALINMEQAVNIPLISDSALVAANMYYGVSIKIYDGSMQDVNRVFQENMRMLEKMPDAYELKARFYTLMADYHSQFSGDQGLVTQFSRQAMDALQGIPYDVNSLIIRNLNEQQRSFRKAKMYDTTLMLLDSSYAFLSPLLEKDPEFYESSYLTVLSNYLRVHAQIDSSGAEKYIDEGYALLGRSENLAGKFSQITFDGYVGVYLAAMGQKGRALPALRKFAEQADQLYYFIEYNELKAIAYEKLALLEAEEKNFEASSNYFDQSLQYTQRVQKSRTNEASAKAAYSLDVAETNLARERAEATALSSGLQSKTDRQNLILGLLTAGLIAGLIGWSYLRVRKNRQTIIEQKAVVDRSLSEKEVLLREIHHRVKNNLQIISSLLQKQARQSESQELKDMIRDGQERIQSMALIHENLYRSEQLSGVSIKKYLEDLTTSMSKSHDTTTSAINIDLRVEDKHLDIDTAIPLGLILNELITNAYKYAFPNGRTGNVLIEFYQKAEQHFLRVSDDGVGLPSDYEVRQRNSLGLNLVKGLVGQLEGNIDWKQQEEGTSVAIQF